MKEIPMPYIKSNQTGIVLFVIAAIVFQIPWLLALLTAIQVAGYIFGLRYNLFIAIAKPFLKVERAETQAQVLTRFNNTIALLFLAGFLICWGFGWMLAGYIIAAMLGAAALAAVLGYCVGCTIYFQYNQFKARAKTQ